MRLPAARFFFGDRSCYFDNCVLVAGPEIGQARKESRNASGGGSGEGSQWASQVATLRSELGISSQWKPVDKLGLTIDGLRATPRINSIINVVVALKIKQKCTAEAADSKKVSKDFALDSIRSTLIDISQNPCRKAWTPKHGCNHTLTTVSHLVHMGAQRVIVPYEQFLWQGHPHGRVKFPDVQNKVLRELSGEGFFLPSFATVLWSLYVHGGLGVQHDVEPDSLSFELID